VFDHEPFGYHEARRTCCAAARTASPRLGKRCGEGQVEVRELETKSRPNASAGEKYDVAVVDAKLRGPWQDAFVLARRLVTDEIASRVVLLASPPKDDVATRLCSRARERREQSTRELALAILRCVLA
jgi:hypothetical protein